MDDDVAVDDYVEQLRQVYDSCDLDDKGYINRNELIDLAHKLQLGEHVETLVTEILGNKFDDGEVSFEAFREGFITVLSKTIGNDVNDVTDDEWSEYDLGDSLSSRQLESLSAKPRYDGSNENVFNSPDANVKSGFPDHYGEFQKRKTSTPNARDRNMSDSPKKKTRVFRFPSQEVSEGTPGQTLTPRTLETPDLLSTLSDYDGIRRVWDDAVGELGYINLHHLASLCELTGMGKLEEDELELLFHELDTNKDGLVSFQEFALGLFASRKKEEEERVVPDMLMESFNANESVLAPTEEEPLGKVGKKDKEKLNKPQFVENLSFLDPDSTGYTTVIKLRELYSKFDASFADLIIKDLVVDAKDRISLKDLNEAIHRMVFNSSDVLSKSLVDTYDKELSFIRGQLEVSRAEVNLYKQNLNKRDTEHKSVLREGDELLRIADERNQELLKAQAQNFVERLSAKERELIKERDAMLQSHQRDIRSLEEKFEKLKSDDGKTKEKLKDATVEILRLEENLKTTIDELNLERKKYSRVEKELATSRNIKEKISELEGQLVTVANFRDKQQSQIKELEKLNKELRDQNDEYLVQIETLSMLSNSRRSQRSQSASPESENLTRNGSYLSDYMKPNVVKRNEFGESCDEDHIVAVSESGAYAVGDVEELHLKIRDQESVITSLRRDLEMINRLLDENTSNTNERHSREISRLTDKFASEMSQLQNLLAREKSQLIESYSREKEELANRYDQQIRELKLELEQKERERWENSTSDIGSEGLFRKEKRKLENAFREEKEELAMNFRSQITKLEEKIVILETDKAEMELQFLNEKAELEQKFRIEKAELQQNASSTIREYDRSQKYIDYLRDDLSKKHVRDMEEIERAHKKEQEALKEKYDGELSEALKQHHKELNDQRKNFNHQISETEKTFAVEKGSMRESFLREKSEMEQRFLREKTEFEDVLKQEFDHKLAVRMADQRKTSMEEKAEIEERLRDEKYQLSKEMQMESALHERNMKQLKSEMELKHAEEKARMREDFEYEKSQLENRCKREIIDLQQAFSGGEAGMKGKMKEDFTNLIAKYKREWESSFEKEKKQLQESFAREKAELELSWKSEKENLEENFEREKMELESVYLREKQEVINKYQQQKNKLENDFNKEKGKLKENRDAEITTRVNRETELLQNVNENLEKELTSLREQKKELQTQNQILELKSLSQKQEADEVRRVKEDRRKIDIKIKSLMEEVATLKKDKEKLHKDLKDLSREKSTILDNSVQEITEQQEKLSRLQSEKEAMQDRIEHLIVVEKEKDKAKQENARILRECSEKQRCIDSLSEVEKENRELQDTIKSLEHRERELENNLQEKILKVTRVEEEVNHLQNKIENVESIHKKEMDALKERLNMQTTATATEKSRYQREVQELKDHLHRANASSDRDSALKEKVFNDAKAEVIALNKKLEEKSRKIRALEESLKEMEGKLYESTKEADNLGNQVKHLKTLINENVTNAREEKRSAHTKSIRSDTLVTDLYLENADLMKQLANAEGEKIKSEKQVRQLTEQKRALQRVISKLCNANGIANPTAPL